MKGTVNKSLKHKMSKVVTSKFGERQLVQLPPVSFSRNSRSAEVPSIVPYQDNRGNYTNRSSSSMQDGQYSPYPMPQNIQPRPEGNIVRDINNPGTDYNVVQPNDGSLHYTPYAMGQQPQQFQQQPQQYQPQPQKFQPQPQAQPPAAPVQSDTVPPQHGGPHHGGGGKEKHIYYGPNGEVLPGPPPGVNMPASSDNPNEKHVYYGPNGEVLSGPPQAPHMAGSRSMAAPQTEFVVEGELHRGKLVAVYNLDSQGYFPPLPDYVLRTLMEKYGQFEITDVRIAYRWKEYNIHGVPRVPMPKERLPPPQKALPPPETIVENETEEIVEYIYPGDKGYDEAKREIEHREVLGDRDKDRPVTMKDDRRDRRYYTSSVVPEKEYRGDRYYTKSIHPEDRGYRRVDYHTHGRPREWTARHGPEDEYYRRYYDRSYTAPDNPDYRRRANDDPLEGLRWKKERATIAEDRKYNDDKKYTF